jgi:hypothetical protein
MHIGKRIAGLAAVAASACLLSAGLSAPASAVPPGDFGQLRNVKSGKCAAIPEGSTAERVQAIQFDCGGTGNADRYWYRQYQGSDHYGHAIYVFKNALTEKCLTSAGGNGGAAWQYTCTYGDNQKWSDDSANRLHSNSSTSATGPQCLAVPLGQTGNGVKLIHWTCGTGPEQEWAFDLF